MHGWPPSGWSPQVTQQGPCGPTPRQLLENLVVICRSARSWLWVLNGMQPPSGGLCNGPLESWWCLLHMPLWLGHCVGCQHLVPAIWWAILWDVQSFMIGHGLELVVECCLGLGSMKRRWFHFVYADSCIPAACASCSEFCCCLLHLELPPRGFQEVIMSCHL
jgi:hypothetical protein